MLLYECAAVFFCPKFGAAGKKYLVFAGLCCGRIEFTGQGIMNNQWGLI